MPHLSATVTALVSIRKQLSPSLAIDTVLTQRLWQCDRSRGRNENQMANYDDALKVMDAVAKYREDESLPDDPHEIDRLCERLFSDDGFDEVAIAWKRISKYEREVHGGDWPKAD
jgi:hypothetical protein